MSELTPGQVLEQVAAVRADVTKLRAQVNAILPGLRAEIDALREEVREAWNHVHGDAGSPAEPSPRPPTWAGAVKP